MSRVGRGRGRGVAARVAAGCAVPALLMAVAGCGAGAKAGRVPPSSPASGSRTGSSPATSSRAPASVGVTDTQLTVVSHQPLTGTSHPGESEIAPAAQAYFDYLNARGGIFGRHIVFRYVNDHGTAADAKNGLDALLPGAFAVLSGQGTEPHEAVAGELVRAGIPDVFVGSGCACVDQPTTRPDTFGWQPDDEQQGQILGAYIARTFPGKRVGVLYENDELGQAGLAGLQKSLPAAQLVDTEDYAATAGEITGQIARLHAKQAQVVVNFGLPTFTATLALISAELGWTPQLIAPQADPTTLAALVQNQSRSQPSLHASALLDGLITDWFLPSPNDRANPWITLFRRIHDTDPQLTNAPFDAYTVDGMSVAYTFAQALTAAGSHPTRAGLVRALTATTLSAHGPGLVPLRYSSTDHRGFAGVQLGTVNNGTLTLSGPVYRVGPQGTIAETSPATPVVPAGGVPPGSGATVLPTSASAGPRP